jgi:HSP20 family protein
MTATMGWDLFEDLRVAQDEMQRRSRRRARRYGQRYNARGWVPAIDISERKDAYLVSAELPGVSVAEVEITFGDGLLTIQGERHAARDTEGERMHRSERYFGAFRRSITLPSNVQAGRIEATAQDGVLQVLVPKALGVQAKRISVQAGQPKAASMPVGKVNGS